jgi:hypothetical protein
MFAVIAVVVGAIAAWILVDYLMSWRDERLHRGPSAWSEFGMGKTFHSAGFEETQPPAEITDYYFKKQKRRAVPVKRGAAVVRHRVVEMRRIAR